MLKKLSTVISVAFLFAILFSVTAYAASNNDFSSLVNQANASIQAEIDKAVIDADKALDDLMSKIDATNLLLKQGRISKCEADGRIKNYKADFENLLQAISSRLIERTEGIVENLMQEAQRRNIKISKTYIAVNLAGRIYLVDPLRIVGN
jgi:peptidoglycan hydrolase CwlO-like protein